jgi:glyoxylase I family protein
MRRQLMFKRIDHMELIALDLDKTLDFYTRILGFKIKDRHPGAEGTPFKEIVFLSLNDTMLEVLKLRNPDPPRTKPDSIGCRGMAIEVEDMDAAIDYLRKKGVEITKLPMLMGKSKRAEIRDPEGLLIELRQW